MARSKMALAVIWVSVGVGVVLGLWQRVATRATGPIRTFAVVAAGLVVALSLLPHAIASKGLAGLAVAMASVALIPGLERLVRGPFRNLDGEGLRLELAFAGLLVHRFGDGVVMAVEGHGIELSWAVGAHEIPIVALVTLAYAKRGLQTALVRAALLGFASSLGYWLVRSMPGAWHDLHGWVDAVAAGILVHILAYEALPESLENDRERARDVLGAVLGVLIVVLPGVEQHENVPSLSVQLLRGSLHAAPWLALGLVGSALLLARVPRRPRDAPPRVALARPWPGLEAFTLAARSLGALATFAWLLASSALAALATAALRRLTPTGAAPPATEPESSSAPLPLGATLEALLLRVGGWIALGLLGQSYIESFVPGPEPLGSLHAGGRAVMTVAVALASSVCSAGAVPIAASLVAKGLAPTIALAGLAMGPVLSNSVNLQRRAGVSLPRASLTVAPLGFAALGLVVWSPAVFAELARPPAAPAPGLVEWAALAALGAVVAKSIWRVGIRGWLGSSLRALGPAARREHAHVQ